MYQGKRAKRTPLYQRRKIDFFFTFLLNCTTFAMIHKPNIFEELSLSLSQPHLILQSLNTTPVVPGDNLTAQSYRSLYTLIHYRL
ncbi:hypothetical protein FKM82_006733 [Ascaphus truei]